MDIKEKLNNDIQSAVENKPENTPIENITESLDNSPIWPAETGIENLKKKEIKNKSGISSE